MSRRGKEFRFHDGYLRKLETIDPRGMRLLFTDTEGREQEVILEEIDDFKCNNFRTGNIVFEVEERTGDSLQDGEILELLRHETENEYENIEARKEEVKAIRTKIASGELKFFRVGSSYGAEVWATCKRIVFK